jgi:hypothetical protein
MAFFPHGLHPLSCHRFTRLFHEQEGTPTRWAVAATRARRQVSSSSLRRAPITNGEDFKLELIATLEDKTRATRQERYFSIFQTQPGSASSRSRRSGAILSLLKFNL